MADERQTIAQIPYNLDDSTSLSRFLGQLVENLDIVLGYRGDTKYVTDEDLNTQGVNLSNLSGQLKDLKDSVSTIKTTLETQTESVESLEKIVEGLTYVTETQVIGSSYYNFNNAAWGSLRGKSEFSTTGSNISNAPLALSGGDAVDVYIDSTKTSDSVWQTILIIVNDVDKSTWTRRGVNSDWLEL